MYSQKVMVLEEYKQRLTDRESRVADREQAHVRLGYVRLPLAMGAAVIGWESFWKHAFPAWWNAVPLTLLVVVAAIHSRILRSLATVVWSNFRQPQGHAWARRPLRVGCSHLRRLIRVASGML